MVNHSLPFTIPAHVDGVPAHVSTWAGNLETTAATVATARTVRTVVTGGTVVTVGIVTVVTEVRVVTGKEQ